MASMSNYYKDLGQQLAAQEKFDQQVQSTQKKAWKSGAIFPGTSGNVCGRDDGVDSLKKQKRNSYCSCGSGKKAKHCHIYFVPPGTFNFAEGTDEQAEEEANTDIHGGTAESRAGSSDAN
jgi:hypothetical protein